MLGSLSWAGVLSSLLASSCVVAVLHPSLPLLPLDPRVPGRLVVLLP